MVQGLREEAFAAGEGKKEADTKKPEMAVPIDHPSE